MLVVLDAMNGNVVGRSVICAGVDASGFDPEKKLIFESCGEGVITPIRQVSPDYYQVVDTIKTQLYGVRLEDQEDLPNQLRSSK